MSGGNPVEVEAAAEPAPYRVRLLWTGGSALGALIGTIGALTFFPNAAFGANRTGQFGWHLVGFASLIGASLGLSQWLILRYLLKPTNATNRLVLHFWMPATALGITAMLLPLWWRDAAVFVLVPWMSVVPMLPGILLLGVAQRFILRRLISARLAWVLPTTLGVAIGSTLGLIAVIAVAVLVRKTGIEIQLSIDSVWSLVTGTFLGLLQASALAADLRKGRRREDARP